MMLFQEKAEEIGSGEQTFDRLTTGVQSESPGTDTAGTFPPLADTATPGANVDTAVPQARAANPPQQQDALSLFRLEAARTRDPLSQFEQQKAREDKKSSEFGQLEIQASAVKAETRREHQLLQTLAPKETQVVELGGDAGLNDALAQFGQEQSRVLAPTDRAQQAKPHSAILEINNESEQGGDLGESDSVNDSSTAELGMDAQGTQQALNAQINQEAAKAAKEVLKDTMKNVENDFLMSEKQLTKDGSGPELTLQALRRPSAQAARAAKERQDSRNAAKTEHKKQKLEAKLAYDKAIQTAHKTAKQQLDHTISGLKMQFSVKKKSLHEEAKIQIAQAKQKMLDQIRTAEMVAVNRLQATLPLKLAKAKQKAEAQAQHAASLAISEITQENKKIRQSLDQQLGEANTNLQAAQVHLTNSDSDPTTALKSAVAVKTEKEHVQRLGELANVALTQQKARAATEVAKAQQDAKESVRLAMKTAKKSALESARAEMSAEQKKIRSAAKKAFHQEETEINATTQKKVTELQQQMKGLVDAAIQRAPIKEQELHHAARKAYKEAIHAADNMLAEKMEKTTPEVTVSDGSTVNRDIAESALENPTESKAFTLENQNFEAAAKFAASNARKAQRKLAKTKQESVNIMKQLAKDTKAAKIAAEKAEALDEKVTRIKLAKLQLNEAKAASAFNKAARAHLEEELAKKQELQQPAQSNGASNEFEKSLKTLQKQARLTTHTAFKEASDAAKDLVKTPVLV